MATKVDKAKAMKASTAAEFARLIGRPEKAVRAYLRRQGIHVSKTEFGTKAKNLLWDHFVAGKDAKKTSSKKSSSKRSKKAKTEAVPAQASAE